MRAEFNQHHELVVVFDYPAFDERDGDHTTAMRHIKEAGYDVNDAGTLIRVLRQVEREGEFVGKYSSTEAISCARNVLSAALAVSRDELLDLISQAFEVYQEAKQLHVEEIEQYRKAAGARRGRPPMDEEQRRSSFIGANVTTDLKEWAEKHPEGVSALVNRLLNEERDRQNHKLFSDIS